jgi:aminoglycoside phosphotransferase (APT) family kinase protein
LRTRSDLASAELARVADLLSGAGEPVAGPLSAALIMGGKSNLTYRLGDGSSSWVLRRPPQAGLTPSAHDMGREYRVCAALHGTEVPVARPVVHDREGSALGAEATVFEFVEGVVARSRDDIATWISAEFERSVEALVDVLVRLHALDPDEIGLGAFARRDGHAERQLSRWAAQWRSMGIDRPDATRLRSLLEAKVPQQSRVSLVHGDFRIDNVLLDRADPGRILAVVDWELSTLGDPHSDLALMAAYRHPRLDAVLGLPAAWTSGRFPEPDSLRSLYESTSGSTVPSWGFHLGLAYYKLAGITEGIAHRERLGASSGSDVAALDDAVGAFLDAGLEAGARRD